MIIFFLKICILIYLLYSIHYIHSLIQYNTNSKLITISIPHKDKIQDELKDKNPLLILHSENNLGLTIHNMNYLIPGYIIKHNDTLLSLQELVNSTNIQIENNKQLIDDFNLITYSQNIYQLFKQTIDCNISYSLSLYKGNYQSKLFKNYHETLLFQPLYNDLIIYIFNPKHETDIKGLDINNIKKWGIKINLKKDNILFIPTEWLYFYELNNELILLKIEKDTIPCWLFNYIRKK